MAIGSSGRIVIEVDPELKRQLHKLLRENGSNVKEWFTDHALDYIATEKTNSKSARGKKVSAKEKS
jgi:hypothetical protein